MKLKQPCLGLLVPEDDAGVLRLDRHHVGRNVPAEHLGRPRMPLIVSNQMRSQPVPIELIQLGRQRAPRFMDARPNDCRPRRSPRSETLIA